MPDEPEVNGSGAESPTKPDASKSDADEPSQSETNNLKDIELRGRPDDDDDDEIYPPNQLANPSFPDYLSGEEIAAAAAARHRIEEESGDDGSPFEPNGDVADSEGSSDGEPEPAPVQAKVRLA